MAEGGRVFMTSTGTFYLRVRYRSTWKLMRLVSTGGSGVVDDIFWKERFQFSADGG